MSQFDLKPAPETVHEAEAYGQGDQWVGGCKCGWRSEPPACATYGAAISRALRQHLDNIPVREHYVTEESQS